MEKRGCFGMKKSISINSVKGLIAQVENWAKDLNFQRTYQGGVPFNSLKCLRYIAIFKIGVAQKCLIHLFWSSGYDSILFYGYQIFRLFKAVKYC